MNYTTGNQIVNEGKFFYINVLISEEWMIKLERFKIPNE